MIIASWAEMTKESGVMDDMDRKIVRALQRDGRLSLQALGEEVGLTPSPCARRIRDMEDRGIIRGYTALIDETRIGFPVSVFVSVKLDKQVDDALRMFETAVVSYPEVVDCWLMTGNRDYLLRVATTDLADFEAFLTSRLTRLPCVASIESSIPLRRVKGAVARSP